MNICDLMFYKSRGLNNFVTNFHLLNSRFIKNVLCMDVCHESVSKDGTEIVNVRHVSVKEDGTNTEGVRFESVGDDGAEIVDVRHGSVSEDRT